MPRLSLSKIVSITGGALYGDGDHVVEILQIDSRNTVQGDKDLFIAIKGPRHDGHMFIPDLIDRGTRNFIVEQNIPTGNKNVNYIKVADSVTALQQIAAWYRSQLKMPLVAITGSNGKTVVKEWLSQCLAQYNVVSRSPKSYNSQTGVPLSVWMLNPGAVWAVIEAGISMPGEMEKLRNVISPDYGIFTNIGPPHQENFSSQEEKLKEKLKLFTGAKILYYCRDHEPVHDMIRKSSLTCEKVSWSVKYRNSYLFITKLENKANHSVIHFKTLQETGKAMIPFTDQASVENCLHILCFMLHRGFSSAEVAAALGQLKPVAMRLEQVKGIKNSTLINDSYNSDLNSLRIALDYLATQKKHHRHALILSDIKQSGKNPEELYSEVVKLVKPFGIDIFIAIGNEISNYQGLPEKTFRFKTTSDFLDGIHLFDFSDTAILIKGAREFGFEHIVNILSEKKHTTVLEINLNNLLFNLNYFRSILQPGTRMMVMVKALTYGSGGYEIANLLQYQKIDYLGVAFTDEGIDLRNSGITLPVMVMAPSSENYEKIVEYNLEPEIFSFSGLNTFSGVLSHNQVPEYPVHIKIDTGMHRLGFMPSEKEKLAEELLRLKNIRVQSIFSHLAVSGNQEEDDFTMHQIRIFSEVYSFLASKLGYKPLRHILNSSGIERFPDAQFEMVRLGIGLHGISVRGSQLKTVSTLKTCITQIKHIPATETIGYNRRGVLTCDSVIATIPIGYADGLDRKLGNGNGQVIVKNRKVPFIGDICMDLCMIDVTGIDVSEGDEVIIFSGDNRIEQLAEKIGTIPYEILTNVSTRVKRVYINE